MTRRFRVSAVLTAAILVVAMGGFELQWVELVLATPVVLWGGWPFFVRGWQSVVNRSLNMFTLIALGVGVAYSYSVVAALLPGIFPPTFRDESGRVGVYFEAAAVIVTLVLLGQVMELRARSQTGAAIRALLGLAPKTARRLKDDTLPPDVLDALETAGVSPQRLLRRCHGRTPRPPRQCRATQPPRRRRVAATGYCPRRRARSALDVSICRGGAMDNVHPRESPPRGRARNDFGVRRRARRRIREGA